MPLKDFLVRVLAVKLRLSEKTIEAVVNHQFQSANEAMKTNDSIEISGFGKFSFNTKKAEKRLAFLLERIEEYKRQMKDPLPITQLDKLPARISHFEKEVEWLKTKLK
jgi:hypothetical protein